MSAMLHGIWISRSSPDPLRDTPFREIQSQLERFAVMRGVPQVRFSETIRKIKARASLLKGFRSDQDERLGPPGPERSQRNARTTCARQLIDGDVVACRASNCRRRGRFSRTRSSWVRKTLTNDPRRCRMTRRHAVDGRPLLELTYSAVCLDSRIGCVLGVGTFSISRASPVMSNCVVTPGATSKSIVLCFNMS